MSHIDLEQGTHRRDGSDVSSREASVCFSEADEGSCYSQFYSTAGGSYDDYSFTEGEIDGGASDPRRVSDCSVEAEIEGGVAEIKVHLAKVEKDCRICHLGLESNSHESGVPIELGCSCKDDLAAAHKLCAEAWFKIRGNKTCEICHSIARNVVGVNEGTDQSNDTNSSTTTAAVPGPAAHTDTPSFWHGHRILNFLLACMLKQAKGNGY
ncbi:hypothetical protein E1A91_D04G148400v1 [Gossypium mustelinum]|uniref:RING-CH-type domain-containing protein n=1 Tax=Gossypium mustelinum TaxID=34275 RepID=A0A5D2VE06_GOSMU|nr:hypothetical protein E1A91_D04G148400v1 [Gossypium mustelinum]